MTNNRQRTFSLNTEINELTGCRLNAAFVIQDIMWKYAYVAKGAIIFISIQLYISLL